jgi:hypothetical protein
VKKTKQKASTQIGAVPNDGRYIGVVSGCRYEVKDGAFILSPLVCDNYKKLVMEEQGLSTYLAAMNSFFAANFERVNTAKTEWWDKVFEDCRIARGTGVRYLINLATRRIEPVPEKPEPE